MTVLFRMKNQSHHDSVISSFANLKEKLEEHENQKVEEIKQKYFQHYALRCKKGTKTLIEKHPACAQCNKNNVAVIFWGYPADVDAHLKEIDDKEIVVGGCLVSNNDPKWECTDCHFRWGIRDEDEDR